MVKKDFSKGFSKDEAVVVEELSQSINFSTTHNFSTNFLTEFEQKILQKLVNHNYGDFSIEFFGGYQDAERKKAKLIINPYYDIEYEIICLKATYNSKFNELKHKDVLGAVHNLGLNYNRIGDIFIEGENIYIFVDRSIAQYIKFNLEKIGRINLQFEEINLETLNIVKKYESFAIVSSSFRLDSIVAKITNKSRSKVKEMLEQGFIKLNHVVVVEGEKNCSLEDMISIRRYGRYTLKNVSQNKKSLKYRITIDKLI